jgi:hypothetical protein
MSRKVIEQHPEEYRQGLNPDYRAGENPGPVDHEMRHGDEIKDLYDLQPELSDDELKQIPILVEGTRLEQGAVYFDLRNPERGEIRAFGAMEAGRDNWYVPKSDCDYTLWNRLLELRRPGRDACAHANP